MWLVRSTLATWLQKAAVSAHRDCGRPPLDYRFALLREPVPGALFANLHVTAVAPRTGA
jgi:hypothetical protein